MPMIRENTSTSNVHISIKQTKRKLRSIQSFIVFMLAITAAVLLFFVLKFKYTDIFDRMIGFGVVTISTCVLITLFFIYKGYKSDVKEYLGKLKNHN